MDKWTHFRANRCCSPRTSATSRTASVIAYRVASRLAALLRYGVEIEFCMADYFPGLLQVCSDFNATSEAVETILSNAAAVPVGLRERRAPE